MRNWWLMAFRRGLVASSFCQSSSPLGQMKAITSIRNWSRPSSSRSRTTRWPT
uniref:Uncharacterized protein n=1 Tax=uncultured marine virus TaxID=186617 RepID=A0A0F7L6F9_9VIRU|nr:hypothetical protein [uncultured marine virus]